MFRGLAEEEAHHWPSVKARCDFPHGVRISSPLSGAGIWRVAENAATSTEGQKQTCSPGKARDAAYPELVSQSAPSSSNNDHKTTHISTSYVTLTQLMQKPWGATRPLPCPGGLPGAVASTLKSTQERV